MHRHLHPVVGRPEPRPGPLRPAKLVSLDARRQARLERFRPRLPHERPAA